MTRGRQSNTAHVVTGKTAPPGHQPYQQAAPESVLAGVMQRDDGDLSATEQIRQAHDQSGGTGHLLALWTAAIRQTLHPGIDEQIKARLTETEAWRYDHEPARQALHQRLRAAQLAGHDISTLIDQITAAPMDRADAWRQAAGARTRHDHTAAANATALAAHLAAQRQRLEADHARYEQWSASTRVIRDTAGKATAELQRRGQAQPDAGAVNCAGAGEPPAASNIAAPRSPQRVPDMHPPSTPKPELRTTPENEPAQQNQSARLAELLARAGQAALRIAVQKAERQAGSQYAARMELEAQAGTGQQPEALEELELEL